MNKLETKSFRIDVWRPPHVYLKNDAKYDKNFGDTCEKQKLFELQDRHASFINIIENLKLDNNNLIKQLKEKNVKIVELRLSNNRIRSELDDKLDLTSKLKNKIKKLKEQHNETITKNKAIEKKLTELKIKIKNYSLRIAMLIKENEELNFDELKEENESLKSCINELNSKLEYSTMRLEECSSKKRSLEKSLALKDAEFEEYSNQIKNVGTQVKTECETELTRLQQMVSVEDSMKMADEKIIELNNLLITCNKDKEKAQNEVKELNAEISILKLELGKDD